MPTRRCISPPGHEPGRLARQTLLALTQLLISFPLLLGASPAAAQFIQYVAPGTLGYRVQNLEDRLEQGAQNARYRFGKLRVEPVLFIRDVGYQSNVFASTEEAEEISDYRLLVAAGLNSYLRLGEKAMLAAFVTPEYSWWKETEDLRQFNLSLGAGVFGFFNRLSVSADGRRLQQENPLNGEVTAPATIEEDRLSLNFEVEARRSLFVFVGLRSSKYRHSGAVDSRDQDLNLLTLDRDFTSARAGLRFQLGPAWSMGAGVEESENDFPFDPGQRSSNGTSPFVELRFAGNRISAQLSLFDSELDFAPGSTLSSLSSSTGLGRVVVETPRGLELALYASRNIVFSAREEDSLFVEQRFGMSLGRQPRRGLSWLAFVESGDLDYSGSENEGRVDDMTAFGLTLDYDLSERLGLVLSYEDIDYQSSLPEFDRGFSNLGLRLAWHENLFPF